MDKPESNNQSLNSSEREISIGCSNLDVYSSQLLQEYGALLPPPNVPKLDDKIAVIDIIEKTGNDKTTSTYHTDSFGFDSQNAALKHSLSRFPVPTKDSHASASSASTGSYSPTHSHNSHNSLVAMPHNLHLGAKSSITLKPSYPSVRELEVADYKTEVGTDDHLLTVGEVIQKYSLDIRNGLDSLFAEEQLIIAGKNVIPRGSNITMCHLLCTHMLNGFACLMWFGAILTMSAFLMEKILSNHTNYEYLGLAIMLSFVVVFSGMFGLCSDLRALRQTDAFEKMMPSYTKVLRDGYWSQISCEDLVIGDLVEVQLGDVIPADIRIIEAFDMKVDNSAITGESEPQARSINCTSSNPLESENLAFCSSNVVEGNGRGIVIATGVDTMIGHIAVLAKGLSKEETPMTRDIRVFARFITIVSITIGILFLVISLTTGTPFIESLVLMLSIIVANVPEGLIVTVTIALTLTTRKMANKQCLVKDNYAVETLGCTTIICSDKTGTLTQNRMTVSHVSFDMQLHDADPEQCNNITNVSFKYLCRCATLCLRAQFAQSPSEENAADIKKIQIIGDASESAILRFMELVSQGTSFYRFENPKVFEVPFKSSTKYQLSIHRQLGSEKLLLVMKGAPEVVIAFCTKYCDDGKTVNFNQKLISAVHANCYRLATSGQRVLAFADLDLPDKFHESYRFTMDPVNFPIDDCRFIGLISMIDPPRIGVSDAVHRCKTAGIRVCMVTGDHPLTALAIAREVGIVSINSKTKYDRTLSPDDSVITQSLTAPISESSLFTAAVITGDDLRSMKKVTLKSTFLRYHELVFARTSPQQKLMIVEAAQSMGHIVAVTGDGVNDSPAIKRANIGIAMGISGQEVPKQAADLILLDDDFATIVIGIEEGRLIFDNLKKSIAYTLTSNILKMAPYLSNVALGVPLPLGLVFILIIDFGTDLLPAIAMAYEKPESDIMNQPPRNIERERLVNFRLLMYAYMIVGVIQTCAGFCGYFIVMAAFGFYPSRLLRLADEWDSPKVDDLEDSFGEKWDFEQRYDLLRMAQTSYFASATVTQVADVLICKTRRVSLFKQGLMNWALNFGMLFQIFIALFIIYMPFCNLLLGTKPIYPIFWLCGMPFFFLMIIADEFRKYMIRKYPRGWFDRYTYY